MIFLDIVIDYERRVVMKKNQPVELTRTEFERLYYLLKQEGRVISRIFRLTDYSSVCNTIVTINP